ncbi:MAG: lipocalin family protein [Cyclobacteriaceae bacterium]
MKKFIYLFFAIGLMFSACEENLPPSIADQSFTIEEGHTGVIGTISAVDGEGDPLTFRSLASNEFEVDPSTGAITGKVEFDYEDATGWEFEVGVKDLENPEVFAFITIIVTDVDENLPPVATDQTFSVDEESPEDTEVGQIVAVDPEGGKLTFEFPTAFFDNFKATEDGKISVNGGLDYETVTQYSYDVDIFDENDASVRIKVTIDINDIQENQPPTVTDQTITFSEDVAFDVLVGTLTASDPNGDPIAFDANDDTFWDYFSLGETDGKLYTKDGFDYETKPTLSFQMSVQDYDATTEEFYNDPVTFTLTINLTDALESIAGNWFVDKIDSELVGLENADANGISYEINYEFDDAGNVFWRVAQYDNQIANEYDWTTGTYKIDGTDITITTDAGTEKFSNVTIANEQMTFTDINEDAVTMSLEELNLSIYDDFAVYSWDGEKIGKDESQSNYYFTFENDGDVEYIEIEYDDAGNQTTYEEVNGTYEIDNYDLVITLPGYDEIRFADVMFTADGILCIYETDGVIDVMELIRLSE